MVVVSIGETIKQSSSNIINSIQLISFVNLGAVDAASVLSRALLSCPIKEARPSSPHKTGQSKDGSGGVEDQKRDVDRGQMVVQTSRKRVERAANRRKR